LLQHRCHLPAPSLPTCLPQELAALHAEKAKVQGYFSFLDAFQRGHAEEYADIGGVLERHATLRDAHSDLLAEQARIMSEIEEQRRHVTRVQKAASMQLLNSENTSARLKAHLEEARTLAGAMQAGADEGAVRKGLRVLELGQVLQSVYNLHSRCIHCAHGAVLRHSPADGAVLGLGGGFRGPEEDDGDSEDEADEGAEEEEEEARGSGSVRRGGAAGRTGPGSPSAPSPSLRGSTRLAGGGGGEQEEEGEEAPAPHVATPDPISSRDLAAMNPRVVRRRLRQAMSLLNVVGSFIADFSDMAADFPAWQAEQRRRQGERDALAAEESRRLAAARAAREAGGAGGDTSRLLLRGGKPVPPAVAAALASGAGLPSGVRLSLSVSGARAFAAAGSSAGVASGGVAMGHQPLAAGVGAAGSSGPFTGKGGAKIWAVRGAHLPPAVVAKLQAGALAATLTDRDGSDAAASSSGGAALGITAGTSAAPAAAAPGYSGPATSVTPARLGAAGRKPAQGR
jgi:hypothetical protein